MVVLHDRRVHGGVRARPQIIFVTLGALIFFPAERRVIKSPWFLRGGCW